MQQDNTTVKKWTQAQTADTKNVEVNNENNRFTVSDPTGKACLQLHACLSKHSSIGPKQLREPLVRIVSVCHFIQFEDYGKVFSNQNAICMYKSC